MNTNELKKLLKGSTAVLVLDNGEPSYVIVGYDSYKKMLNNNEQEEKEVKINRSFAELSDAKVRAPLNPISFGMAAQSRPFEKERGQRDSVQLLERDDGQFQHRVGEKESEFLEKINKQILSLKDEIEKEEKGAGIDPALNKHLPD
jgi:hypothetical protein